MSVRQRSWLGALLMALALGCVVAAATDFPVFGRLLWVAGPAFIVGFTLVLTALRRVSREIHASRGHFEAALRAEAERHKGGKPDA